MGRDRQFPNVGMARTRSTTTSTTRVTPVGVGSMVKLNILNMAMHGDQQQQVVPDEGQVTDKSRADVKGGTLSG